MKKSILTLVILSLFAEKNLAQNFKDYTVSTQQETYTSLDTTKTTVSPWYIWDYFYEQIECPINLNIMGLNVDSIGITVGSIFFLSKDNPEFCIVSLILPPYDEKSYTFGSFVQDYRAKYPTNGDGVYLKSRSKVGYKLEEVEGSRVLKIEYADCAYSTTQNDTLQRISQQIWLYEGSNNIELHIGPSKLTLPKDSIYPYSGLPSMFLIKTDDEINAENDYNSTIVLYGKTIIGNSNNVSGEIITNDEFNKHLSYPHRLSDYPSNGTVYRFTPEFTTSISNQAQSAFQYSFYKNKFIIKSSNINLQKVELFDSFGRLLSEKMMTKGDELNIIDYPNGLYLIKVEGEMNTIKVIKE
jgi:hypothetical protein